MTFNGSVPRDLKVHRRFSAQCPKAATPTLWLKVGFPHIHPKSRER